MSAMKIQTVLRSMPSGLICQIGSTQPTTQSLVTSQIGNPMRTKSKLQCRNSEGVHDVA